MKFLIPVILLVSFEAQAATKLLDCNVQGPDQQVTVIRDRDGLILKELTNNGSWIERKLSAEEWDARLIRLEMNEPQTELNARNPSYYILQYRKESNRWSYDYRANGWREVGMADCW